MPVVKESAWSDRWRLLARTGISGVNAELSAR
jgi:hypothetical protein